MYSYLRLLVCHADAGSLRILFTGKMLDTIEKALGLPGLSKNKTAWKCLLGQEIRGTTRAVAREVDTQTCQSVGTLSMALDESRAHLSPGKADMRYMTGLIGTGHFLMLRFWLQESTPRNAGGEGCPVPILFYGQGRL